MITLSSIQYEKIMSTPLEAALPKARLRPLRGDLLLTGQAPNKKENRPRGRRLFQRN